MMIIIMISCLCLFCMLTEEMMVQIERREVRRFILYHRVYCQQIINVKQRLSITHVGSQTENPRHSLFHIRSITTKKNMCLCLYSVYLRISADTSISDFSNPKICYRLFYCVSDIKSIYSTVLNIPTLDFLIL